jgi:hypothetical protein
MKIFYRISDTGYPKNKPSYINNKNCLHNFCQHFDPSDINIIADNVSDNTYKMINEYVKKDQIEKVAVGHGAGTFNLALDRALLLDDEEYIYFVENDYLHRTRSSNILLEGFTIGFPYITLYDHPDKYIDPSNGGNPFCSGGAENTRVYLSQSCHWKITNSTTMTFATTVKTLKQDEYILRKWTSGTHPNDFQMFLELAKNQKFLISPIPGYSTHGETQYLSPLINWNNYV